MRAWPWRPEPTPEFRRLPVHEAARLDDRVPVLFGGRLHQRRFVVDGRGWTAR